MGMSSGKAFHVHLDSGSVGCPFCVCCFTMGNLRGTYTPDPIHMMHNRRKAAQKTAEVWWVYMETTVAYTFSNGPFGKQACALRRVQGMLHAVLAR